MRWHLPMIAAAGLLLAADAAKDDRDKLQGTWAVVLGERDGEKLGEEAASRLKLAFEGDRYILHRGDETRTGVIKLDPSKQPKAIDVEPPDGKTRLGIYAIEGDTAKFCFAEYGRDRPAEFATKAESGLSLYVVRRVKP